MSGNFGFIRWNDSENSINLGHSYGSAFNENVKVQNTGTVVLNDAAQTAADFRVEETATLICCLSMLEAIL